MLAGASDGIAVETFHIVVYGNTEVHLGVSVDDVPGCLDPGTFARTIELLSRLPWGTYPTSITSNNGRMNSCTALRTTQCPFATNED